MERVRLSRRYKWRQSIRQYANSRIEKRLLPDCSRMCVRDYCRIAYPRKSVSPKGLLPDCVTGFIAGIPKPQKDYCRISGVE
jgi:hypothetical protein